jgi:hypothetical protein
VSLSGISITFSFNNLKLAVSVGYQTNGLEEGWNYGKKLSLVVNWTFLSIVGFKPTRKKFYFRADNYPRSKSMNIVQSYACYFRDMKDEAVETLIVSISCSAPLYYSGTLSKRLLTSMAILHDCGYGGQGAMGPPYSS